MNFSKILILTVAILSSGIVADTRGQEVAQTPENAVKFLKITAQHTSIRIHYIGADSENFNTAYWNGRVIDVGSGKMKEIEYKDSCVSIVRWSKPHAYMRPSNFIYTEEEDEFDWKAITNVKQNNKFVSFVMRGKQSRWEFASDDIAARAAYAMEFVRISCDASAATGF